MEVGELLDVQGPDMTCWQLGYSLNEGEFWGTRNRWCSLRWKRLTGGVGMVGWVGGRGWWRASRLHDRSFIRDDRVPRSERPPDSSLLLPLLFPPTCITTVKHDPSLNTRAASYRREKLFRGGSGGGWEWRDTQESCANLKMWRTTLIAFRKREKDNQRKANNGNTSLNAFKVGSGRQRRRDDSRLIPGDGRTSAFVSSSSITNPWKSRKTTSACVLPCLFRIAGRGWAGWLPSQTESRPTPILKKYIIIRIKMQCLLLTQKKNVAVECQKFLSLYTHKHIQYMCMCIHIHMCIHIYAHTYINTYTHTYIHTHIYIKLD